LAAPKSDALPAAVLRKAGALALAWCCLGQAAGTAWASELPAAQNGQSGNRLRILQVNHREPKPLNTPASDWRAVEEPSRYGNQQLPAPRLEQEPAYEPVPGTVRSMPADDFEAIPPANRGDYRERMSAPVMPGQDLERHPQDVDRTLEELLPSPNEQRPAVMPRMNRPAPEEMTFPVRQPGPGGMQPVPQDRGGRPGPLDCADLDRFYDPTQFSSIGIDISVKGEAPPDCPLPQEAIFPNYTVDVYHRNWACLTYTWKASALCHKPLYFEEMSVERYGHSWGIAQPVVSGAHFFGSLALLPYQMGVHPPGECIYPLGYYRPGSCAPKMWYQAPLSLRGALAQGGAVTGLVFLLP